MLEKIRSYEILNYYNPYHIYHSYFYSTYYIKDGIKITNKSGINNEIRLKIHFLFFN